MDDHFHCLLCLLNNLAAASEAKRQNVELILPDLDSLDARDNVANKIVVRVCAANAAQVARAMEKAVRDCLTSLAKVVFDRIRTRVRGGIAPSRRRGPGRRSTRDFTGLRWTRSSRMASPTGARHGGAPRLRSPLASRSETLARDLRSPRSQEPIRRVSRDGHRRGGLHGAKERSRRAAPAELRDRPCRALVWRRPA